MDERLKVTLSGWELDNPVIPASGTFGFGYEFADFYDINILGSIATKGTTREARFGNPTPRIAECERGMINAVGLQNPGIDKVISEEFPKLKQVYQKKVVANVSGFSKEEYVECAKKMDAQDIVGILEVNISCPNVHGGGMSFGVSPDAAVEITRAVKAVTTKPVYIKLSPNVTDIVAIAKACENAGADGISMINTLLGARFDLRTGRPIIANVMGGFSGPAIKPVALRMVYQVYEAVKLPIIGIGGIASAEDVIEMMYAGATAVEIGADAAHDVGGNSLGIGQFGQDKLREGPLFKFLHPTLKFFQLPAGGFLLLGGLFPCPRGQGPAHPAQCPQHRATRQDGAPAARHALGAIQAQGQEDRGPPPMGRPRRRRKRGRLRRRGPEARKERRKTLRRLPLRRRPPGTVRAFRRAGRLFPGTRPQ